MSHLAKNRKAKTSAHQSQDEQQFTTDGKLPLQMNSSGYRINLSKMENAGDLELGEGKK